MVMWLVRLRMRNARPCARGWNRLSVGPSFTTTRSTISDSGSSPWLFSALATAEASSLATGSLAACGANCRMDAASDADRPRIRSTTRRAFIGVNRSYRRVSLLRGSSSTSFLAFIVRLLTAPRPAVVLHVTLEGPRRRELAELVADHRFGAEHRDMLAAVVHRDRVPEHVGDDRGPARPGLDHGLGVLVVRRVHLLEQVIVDERDLLDTEGNLVPTFLLRCRGLSVGLRTSSRSPSPLL